MVYDFLEVAGGVGGMGASLRAKGYVALYVDLALSQHFDMQDDVPLRWVIHMIERQQVGVVFLEPPCMDFCGAKHPATRSYELLRGCPPIAERTRRATRLAIRVLSLFFVAVRCHVLALLQLAPGVASVAALAIRRRAGRRLVRLPPERAVSVAAALEALLSLPDRAHGEG